jgi:hypothetical protein
MGPTKKKHIQWVKAHRHNRHSIRHKSSATTTMVPHGEGKTK